jgi:thermitase
VEAPKRALGLLLSVPLLFTALLTAASPQPIIQPGSTPVPGVDFQPGQVLVKLKPDAPRSLASVLAAGNLSVEDHIPGLDVYVLAVPQGEELAMVEALEKNPAVEYAEPNYRIYAPQPWQLSQETGATPRYPMPLPTVEPNDPFYVSENRSLNWWYETIRAPEAWGITTGSEDVTIAVLCTGARLDHPDLQGKLVPGWDFVNDDDDPTDDNCFDPYWGFGTQLAGVAAAATNNGKGNAGITWRGKVMPVKVLNERAGGWYSDASEGIIYAADNGAQIILMAFQGNESSSTLEEAIEHAHEQGALLIAPMGNCPWKTPGECLGNPTQYPAALRHVVAVAATDGNDERCWFSLYGPHVDVAAPGSYIYNTACGKDYAGHANTIHAAALVAGQAALVYSVNPGLTAEEVEWIIELSADDVGDPGWDEYTGFGRINTSAALLQTPHRLQIDPTSLGFLVTDEGYISPACQLVTNPNTSHWTWTATSPATWLRVAGPMGDINSGYTPSWVEVCASWIDLPDEDEDGWPDYGTYTADLTLSSTMPFVDPGSSRSVHVVFAYVPEARRIYLPLLSRH